MRVEKHIINFDQSFCTGSNHYYLAENRIVIMDSPGSALVAILYIKTSVCTYLSVSPGVRMIQLSDIIIGTSRCREKYFYSTTHDVRNLPGNPSKSASLMSGSEAENLRNRLGFRCRYSKYLANNCGPKNTSRGTVKNNEPLTCRESVTSLCKTLGCYLYL